MQFRPPLHFTRCCRHGAQYLRGGERAPESWYTEGTYDERDSRHSGSRHLALVGISEPGFCGELVSGGATLNQCVKDVDILGRDCNQKNAILVPGKAGQSERASTAKTGSTSVTP